MNDDESAGPWLADAAATSGVGLTGAGFGTFGAGQGCSVAGARARDVGASWALAAPPGTQDQAALYPARCTQGPGDVSDQPPRTQPNVAVT